VARRALGLVGRLSTLRAEYFARTGELTSHLGELLLVYSTVRTVTAFLNLSSTSSARRRGHRKLLVKVIDSLVNRTVLLESV
jgi:hypothetical protein